MILSIDSNSDYIFRKNVGPYLRTLKVNTIKPIKKRK